MSGMAQDTSIAPPAFRRRWRNFLLDTRFQLKFASYVVVSTMVAALLLGGFLWMTSKTLFDEMAAAVDARRKAADTSKELSNATLNNELMQNMDDPAFEKQLKEKSEAIDASFRAELQAIEDQRDNLVRRQQITLFSLIGGFFLFIVLVAAVSIVATHKIVGPLYRLKRNFHEMGQGRLNFDRDSLRPKDELKDVFEAFQHMVKEVRDRETSLLQRVQAALQVAQQTRASDELVRELQTLEAKLKASLE